MKKSKPTEHFTGIDLTKWHSEVENIRWAQTEPKFRVMLSVLLHELENVPSGAINDRCSEGRAFGRLEGFQKAIETLRSMGRKEVKVDQVVAETFDEPKQRSMMDDIRE